MTGRARNMPVVTNASRKRVLVFGASGTIGEATVQALTERGHDTVCFVRPQSVASPFGFENAEIRCGDITDRTSITRDGFRGEHFDAVISCLASRTGVPEDAWQIDYQAHSDILTCTKRAGADHMILLSAICVQKPRLAFQRAKFAFEKELIESGLTYSIVRPTAFFKSLSGQIDRVRRGKPFLLFGNGELTSCKPISDRDLARFIASCMEDPDKQNAVLPIGGPGPAITPKKQARILFELAGQDPRYRTVPVGLLDMMIGILSAAGKVSQWAAEKAEYARIGRYYATESMLVLDPQTGQYDARATPETGSDTLVDHYRKQMQI